MSMFWWWGAAARRRADHRPPDHLYVNGAAYRYVDEEHVESVYPQGAERRNINSDEGAASPKISMPTTSINHTVAPPKSPRLSKRVEKTILLLFPKRSREYLLGDLAEEYAEIAAKHGVRFANLWYGKQVAGSVWPFLRAAIRWWLLTSAWDWVRRLM
jgi:hypothetical protein